jgi:hypothetical protein
MLMLFNYQCWEFANKLSKPTKCSNPLYNWEVVLTFDWLSYDDREGGLNPLYNGEVVLTLE